MEQKVLFWGMELNWEAIAGFVSAIFSIVAIVIANNAFRLSKMQLAGSVRPWLQIVPGKYTNQVFVRLENSGLGPAIITKIKVSKSGTSEVKSSIVKWTGALPNNFPYSNYIDVDQDTVLPALPPGKELPLVHLQINQSDNLQMNALSYLKEELKTLTVTIDYRDFLGNEFETSHRLTYFG